jgi:nitrite reductase (NO-forming)
VRVGDTVRVHLENPKTNKLAHSVDFHASQVAWNDEMTSINPGEKKLYEWRADYAGVWMYHCGSNPALHHIASGMYGMVIVEPAEGLPKNLFKIFVTTKPKKPG